MFMMLLPLQCYPGGVDAAGNFVGCCNTTCLSSPSFGGKRLAVGMLENPLNATEAAAELVVYPVGRAALWLTIAARALVRC